MDKNPEDRKVNLDGDEALAKARQLLPKFRSAMLVTHSDAEHLHVRPLALQGDLSAFGGVLWFFTDVRSRKIQESGGHVPVSVICQSDEHSAYLHLTGTVTVTRDMAKMRELYTPLLKTWFPDGLDDPNLTLIKFDATGGEYWDSPGGMLQVLASFAKAVATGTRGQAGETGALQL